MSLGCMMIKLIPVIVVPEDAEDIRRNVGHTKKVAIKNECFHKNRCKHYLWPKSLEGNQENIIENLESLVIMLCEDVG